MEFSKITSPTEIEVIYDSLVSIPNTMKMRYDIGRDLAGKIDTIESQMAYGKSETEYEVNTEVDEATNKKLYPNAESRASAVAMKLSQDKQYRAWEDEVKTIKLDKSKNDAETFFMRDTFKSMIARAQIVVALLETETAAKRVAANIKEKQNV